jgi:hypothetical protein
LIQFFFASPIKFIVHALHANELIRLQVQQLQASAYACNILGADDAIK